MKLIYATASRLSVRVFEEVPISSSRALMARKQNTQDDSSDVRVWHYGKNSISRRCCRHFGRTFYVDVSSLWRLKYYDWSTVSQAAPPVGYLQSSLYIRNPISDKRNQTGSFCSRVILDRVISIYYDSGI